MPSPEDMPAGSMARRAAGAGAWTVGTRLAAKLIDLAMLLCLARFLGPAEFGLVAMAMAAVFVVEALFDLPMAAALIRVPALSDDLLHTAFTLSLLRGAVVAALLLGLCAPLAAFNHEPRLLALLAVLALAPVLRGLVNPRMVEYARAFDFRPESAMELAGKLLALVVSVAVAASTGSYWAIAAATVCAPFAATVLSYVIAPLRPRLTLVRWAQFSHLVGWNFVAQLCAALNWQIDRLILPRFTSDGAFGQYAVGRQLAEIPAQALIQPMTRPALPALAPGGQARVVRYLQLSGAIALVIAPVLGVALLWPEALVRVALGPAWSEAAEWLRWISAIVVLGLPALLVAPLAMTLDRTHWLAVRTLAELAARLPLVWVGAAQFGIRGAVAGSAIASAIGTGVALATVRRLCGISATAQLMTLARPALAMLPAGALLWFTRPLLAAAPGVLELLLRALPLGLAYLAVYALAALLAWHAAGRPPGLEQHLLERLRAGGRAARARARRDRGDGGPSTSRERALEAHAKQPLH